MGTPTEPSDARDPVARTLGIAGLVVSVASVLVAVFAYLTQLDELDELRRESGRRDTEVGELIDEGARRDREIRFLKTEGERRDTELSALKAEIALTHQKQQVLDGVWRWFEAANEASDEESNERLNSDEADRAYDYPLENYHGLKGELDAATGGYKGVTPKQRREKDLPDQAAHRSEVMGFYALDWEQAVLDPKANSAKLSMQAIQNWELLDAEDDVDCDTNLRYQHVVLNMRLVERNGSYLVKAIYSTPLSPVQCRSGR
jgi:hypothetical protein